jgi:nicotinamidase/pyrazinamidase
VAGGIFWDVDTQYDFMRADGKLYVPDAESIIPNLRRLTDHAHRHGVRVVASADDHVPGHRELSDAPDWTETFPPHCLRGTPGQAKIPETALHDPLVVEPDPTDPRALAARIRAHRGDVLLHKHWFDVFTNPNAEVVVETLAPERVVLYGVATDVCDRYAIDGLRVRWPRLPIFAVTDAMKPIHADVAERLFAAWRAQGVRCVTTDDVLAGRLATTPAESHA